ncbi:MAG: hypothetical protein ABSG53_03415 [Thermoguttaceae bacterium]
MKDTTGCLRGECDRRLARIIHGAMVSAKRERGLDRELPSLAIRTYYGAPFPAIARP